jgi:hypothetical protein
MQEVQGAVKYNPEKAPDPEKWRALEEPQRLDAVSTHHRRMRVKVPKADIHAAIHVIVENQLAEGFALATEALDRLRAEGLDRHEAIHAIGSVLIGHVQSLMQEGATPPDPNGPYGKALRTLTAHSWMEEFGKARTTIPYGSKLPVTLRERDLIRDETFCDPGFAKCAAVDGTGIKVELSLDEIEENRGMWPPQPTTRAMQDCGTNSIVCSPNFRSTWIPTMTRASRSA